MPKRFTDTEKWKRPWFRGLPLNYKLLWLYLLDNCDIAGVWYVDLDLAAFLIGSPVTESEALGHFAKQVDVLTDGKRWWVKDFVAFQYGDLKTTNNLHKAVANLLEKHGLPCQSSGASQGLACPTPGAKDKDKVKEKEKKEAFVRPTLAEVAAYCQERNNSVNPERFIAHYEANGWKVGKNPMKSWRAAIVSTWEQNAFSTTKPAEDDMAARTKAYLAEVRKNG